MIFKVSALGFFLVSTIALTSVDARKPAVDPVQEISIEEYNDVPPEKAQAFDFSQNKKTDAGKKSLVKKQVPVKSIKSLEDKSDSFNFLFLLVFATPFAIWFGIKNLDKNSTEEKLNHDNVTKLETKKDNDDDMNFPKAS